MMAPFVYLAAPYSSGDTVSAEVRQQRFDLSTLAAVKLMAGGVAVFSPVTQGHPMVLAGLTRSHDWWMEICLPYMDAATMLFVLMLDGWEQSDGIQQEVERFCQSGKPVIFLDAEETLRGHCHGGPGFFVISSEGR